MRYKIRKTRILAPYNGFSYGFPEDMIVLYAKKRIGRGLEIVYLEPVIEQKGGESQVSENERACPHCGSRKRVVVLGDNSTFEVMRVVKPPHRIAVRIVVCAECGTVYDAVKEVK